MSWVLARNTWNLIWKKTIYISIQKMKYFGINLTKHVQDLYEENYQILMKGITEKLNK